MKLEDWMKREGLSVTGLAKKAGIFPASIKRLLAGKAYLHPKNEIAIVALTGGTVGFADLRPYIKGVKGKAA